MNGRLRSTDTISRIGCRVRRWWEESRMAGGRKRPAIRSEARLHRRFGQVLHQALGLFVGVGLAGLRQHVVGGLLAEPDGLDVLEHDFAGGGREERADLEAEGPLV